MFISPYETLACKNHIISDAVDDVRKLIMEGDLRMEEDSHRIYYVDDSQKQLKPFAHPIVMTMDWHGDETKFIVCDARSSARVDPRDNKLRGGSDFQYLKLRARLMEICWIENNQLDLLNAGDFQVKIFSTLVTENIGRRLNLEMNTQIRVRAIAAYYYISLFYDKLPEDETGYLKIIKRIGRSIGLSVPHVLEVLDSVPAMYNIHDFTAVLKEHGGSVRMDKLSPGLLYTMLGGIWYGSNNVENVAVALEHPPTFAAMLQMVIDDRGYRKTILGQIVQRFGRDDLAKTFSYHLTRMVTQKS